MAMDFNSNISEKSWTSLVAAHHMWRGSLSSVTWKEKEQTFFIKRGFYVSYFFPNVYYIYVLLPFCVMRAYSGA